MPRLLRTYIVALHAVAMALIPGLSAAFAQGGMGPGPGMVHSTGGGGCPQATTFLARTSLTGSDVTNYTNLICGMVTDSLITGDLSTTGCGSLFDVLYIFATADQTTALLNICSTNFTATNSGTTFTADSGFTGNASDFLDTQFDATTAPSPNFVQNSAHLSFWNLSNTAENVPVINVGVAGTNIYPEHGSGNIFARINDSPESGGFAISDPRGHVLGNRSSSTGRQLYQNASTTLIGGTTATYGSTASQAPNSGDIRLLSGSNRTLAMASIGASLNSTQVTNFYGRLRTYMTAVGVP